MVQPIRGIEVITGSFHKAESTTSNFKVNKCNVRFVKIKRQYNNFFQKVFETRKC